MATLRLAHRTDGPVHVVDITLEGPVGQQTATSRFDFELTAQDQEDLRWYLEDYLQYPVEPTPRIADRVEKRLAALGSGLFTCVFLANRDVAAVWGTVAGSLATTRVEVLSDTAGQALLPWEVLREPSSGRMMALDAGAFVRVRAGASARGAGPRTAGAQLRVLLVISRPGGRADVPFRSVASRLTRLGQESDEALDLDVLRPSTFSALAQVLIEARDDGTPYHVAHFDGHGVHLDESAVDEFIAAGGSLVSPRRPGAHGYLIFEDSGLDGSQVLVDGPAIGRLLADAAVPAAVLNACRSAHAGVVSGPGTFDEELGAHQRARAYGSLAQELVDAGVEGVVAMRYNVYVVTAARFIGDVYAGLLRGHTLSAAATAARRGLADDPYREVGAEPRALQDWLVPVVYESAPLALSRGAGPQTGPGLVAAGENASPVPDAGGGFRGRDEALLAIDRAFDRHPVVLLHGWAGAGKTATAREFARWYSTTGGVDRVIVTSFARRLPLSGLLDRVWDDLGSIAEQGGVPWPEPAGPDRRDLALQALSQVPALWVWDGVEGIGGFPAGTRGTCTTSEQGDLASFLGDLARWTRCKVLLTSRREERPWLDNLPLRVELAPMPMPERLELARAVAAQAPGAERWASPENWRSLLDFTQGNPLMIRVAIRQVISDHLASRGQVEKFVARLRAGVATLTEDPGHGRDMSLAASLGHGFARAFSTDEQAVLALLTLFQGFADTDTFFLMRDFSLAAGSWPEIAMLATDRDTIIRVMDRAAEIGLLSRKGDGRYSVHPAIPWYLQGLFQRYYGPPGSHRAVRAARAWTTAMSMLGHSYLVGDRTAAFDVTELVSVQEANLRHARRLAMTHGWLDLIIGLMQGLRLLYRRTGRRAEWEQLVTELVPVLSAPETGSPLPGLDAEWVLLTGFRIDIAQQARDWVTARHLQQACIAWYRRKAAAALTIPIEICNPAQRVSIYDLAVSLSHLGDILVQAGDPGSVGAFLEAIELFQRIGDADAVRFAASSMGDAYHRVPGLRDLSRAEWWYRYAQPQATGELGIISFEQFLEARAAGADGEALSARLNDAARILEEAHARIPDYASPRLAASHCALGGVYASAGDVSRALWHYQNCIEYAERHGDRSAAGMGRMDAAIALMGADRGEEALCYAREALRDYESFGSREQARLDEVRRLVAYLERDSMEGKT